MLIGFAQGFQFVSCIFALPIDRFNNILYNIIVEWSELLSNSLFFPIAHIIKHKEVYVVVHVEHGARSLDLAVDR